MPLLAELTAYTWRGYQDFAPTELIVRFAESESERPLFQPGSRLAAPITDHQSPFTGFEGAPRPTEG
jgi:hypothetical protein